ncbi:MAG: hypothetical protein R3B96_01345 [Pirellulaceae bacterium]
MSDGENTVLRTVTIDVSDNVAPTIDVPATIVANEGEPLTLPVSIGDADRDALQIAEASRRTAVSSITTAMVARSSALNSKGTPM